MIGWIMLVVGLIVALSVLKLKHLNHRLVFLFFILLALFFYGSIMMVSRSHDLDLSTPEGVMGSIKVYFAWLGNGFTNLKQLTGYAVHMNWTDSRPSKAEQKVNQILAK